jgi:hypothetical protein
MRPRVHISRSQIFSFIFIVNAMELKMPTRSVTKPLSRRSFSGLIISALALGMSFAPTLATGADIYGQVTLKGAPVANTEIQLNGKRVGQTDASGGYRLSLPPGQYTLTILGKSVPIVVPPPGVKQDIQLQ